MNWAEQWIYDMGLPNVTERVQSILRGRAIYELMAYDRCLEVEQPWIDYTTEKV